MPLRLAFTVLAAGALALTACTSAAPATPSPEPPPIITPAPITPAPSTATPATQPPATSDPRESPTPAAIPTLPSADPELEALLPDVVGGYALTKLSLRGDQFMPTAGAEFAEFVGELGVAPQQITASTATGGSIESGETVTAFGLRLPGTSADQLLGTYAEAAQEGDPTIEIEEVEVGGKSVYEMTGGQLPSAVYFHAIEEIFFVVSASTAELSEDALSQLP